MKIYLLFYNIVLRLKAKVVQVTCYQGNVIIKYADIILIFTGQLSTNMVFRKRLMWSLLKSFKKWGNFLTWTDPLLSKMKSFMCSTVNKIAVWFNVSMYFNRIW